MSYSKAHKLVKKLEANLKTRYSGAKSAEIMNSFSDPAKFENMPADEWMKLLVL